MKNIYRKSAEILCGKYKISAQLINYLIKSHKLSQALEFIESNEGDLSKEDKLEILLQSFGSKIFRGDGKHEDLREIIISKWDEKAIEESFEKWDKDSTINQVSRKAKELAKNKSWTFKWSKEFMENSGLPIELAGIKEKNNLPRYEDVLPYFKMPELVPYQEKLKEDLLAVIKEKGDDAKCIITLPTGAGKTRIAVEAYLEYLRPRFSEGKYLIWIAQSEELCEQAIKSFQDRWKSTEFTESLRIFRFYGNHIPTMDDLETGGVVVCGINKLHYSLPKNEDVCRHIIENCGTCIIDEAHRAVTSMYENFYNHAEKIRGEKIFPICGLTATPGRNDDPHKLPTRFKYNIHKPDIPNNYNGNDIQFFRNEGYLAKPKHTIFTTKSEYKFSFESSTDKINLTALENEIIKAGCKQLAKNKKRNRKIVDKLKELHEKSTIVYACTIEHAYNLNAILRRLNMKSVVISGSTPRNERLISIQKFKNREINFIINHSVLTTGFDAPKTDNIVICRPIFSDILYEQIIGRGLRGPKFGGTEYCNIIDFTDNLGRFGDQQSYNRFKELWVEEHEEE